MFHSRVQFGCLCPIWRTCGAQLRTAEMAKHFDQWKQPMVSSMYLGRKSKSVNLRIPGLLGCLVDNKIACMLLWLESTCCFFEVFMAHGSWRHFVSIFDPSDQGVLMSSSSRNLLSSSRLKLPQGFDPAIRVSAALLRNCQQIFQNIQGKSIGPRLRWNKHVRLFCFCITYITRGWLNRLNRIKSLTDNWRYQSGRLVHF